MTTSETAKNILHNGGGRIMHVDAAAGLLCAALLAASSAFGLDVVEVRDVHAVTDYADDSGMEKQLVRTDDALILRVIPGTQVIIR